MSNLVFPSTRGLNWTVDKNPQFSTNVVKTTNGKRVATANQPMPTWNFTLNWEYIKDDTSRTGGNAYSDLRMIAGFFMQNNGCFGTWLFDDPDDDSVTAQSFGTGNASLVNFQLVRDFGGFLETIQNVNGSPLIYMDSLNGLGAMLRGSASRTNLALQSAAFNTTWVNSLGGVGVAPTITANTAAAPDGTTTADRLQLSLGGGSTTSDFSGVQQSITVVNGQPYVFSVWLKSNTGGNFNVNVESASGAPGVVNCLVTPVWQRFTGLVWTSTGTSTTAVIRLRGASGNSTTADILAWGAQYELAPAGLPTAYIPTTTSTVTVGADYALNATGLVTFSSAPPAGALLTWTGSYYFRCAFKDDVTQFEQFCNKLWTLQQLNFESVIL